MTQNAKKNKGAATGRGGHGRLGDEGELKGRRLRTGSQVLRCRLFRVILDAVYIYMVFFCQGTPKKFMYMET